MSTLSPRLAAIVDALPLTPDMRVLEIGGGPGAAAKAVAGRVRHGHICMIDRSAKSIAQAERNAAAEIDAGVMSVRHVAIEDFTLDADQPPFDLAFAVRVGALDGRHPAAGHVALHRIAEALSPRGVLLIDGGDPLREVALSPPNHRQLRAVRVVELLERYSIWANWAKRTQEVTQHTRAAPSPSAASNAKPRPRRLNSTEVDALAQAYADGATVAVLAGKFDINRQTVAAHLRRRQIDPRRRGLDPADELQAVDMYLQGRSLTWVGSRLGVDGETVRRTLVKHGIARRTTHGLGS